MKRYLKLRDVFPAPPEVVDVDFYKHEIVQARTFDKLAEIRATVMADESLGGDEKDALDAAIAERKVTLKGINKAKRFWERKVATMAILALGFIGFSARGMDNFAALSQIETGDRDIVGVSGDVSRYQISRAVWARYTTLPVSAAKNPLTAFNVAKAIMQDRCTAFEKANHRPPTAAEFYILWHRPAQLNHATRATRDLASRFSNLVASK
jgi:hypothetical protein